VVGIWKRKVKGPRSKVEGPQEKDEGEEISDFGFAISDFGYDVLWEPSPDGDFPNSTPQDQEARAVIAPEIP
jgi:hypothetical protein